MELDNPIWPDGRYLARFRARTKLEIRENPALSIRGAMRLAGQYLSDSDPEFKGWQYRLSLLFYKRLEQQLLDYYLLYHTS